MMIALELDGACLSLKSFQENVCAEDTGEEGKGKKSLSLHCEEGILYAKPGLSVTSPFLFLPLNIGDEPIP